MRKNTYRIKFGIILLSGLTPLSRIRDNGIINNGPKEPVRGERPSVLEKLKNAPEPEWPPKQTKHREERGLE